MEPTMLALAAPPVWSAAYVRWAEKRWPRQGEHVLALGTRAHIVLRGPREGSPILFLHGASSSTREFDDVLTPDLCADHFCIAVDRPGLGYSGVPARSYRLATQARFIADALSQITAEPVTVVAHSWGGAVALRLALDHPDRVRSLVLLGPATHPYPGGTSLANRVAAAPLLGPVFSWTLPTAIGPRLIDGGLRNVFSPQPVAWGYRTNTGPDLVLRPRSFRTNAADMAHSNRELAAQAPRYAALDLPVVIYAGKRDGVVSSYIHARALSKEVPGARLHLLEDVGHMPHRAVPRDVAATIRDLARR